MATDLLQFLRRFESTLLDAARRGKALQLGSKLSEYEQLLRCWLEVAPPGTRLARPFTFSEVSPRFAGPLEINLCDVIRAAGRSRDAETYETVINAVVACLFVARDADQVPLYQELCSLLAFGYYVGARDDELAETATQLLDRSLYRVLVRFKSRRHSLAQASREEREAAFQQEQPYLDAALALVLQIVSTAMEEGRQQAAGYFMSRLVEHRKHANRRWRPGQRASMEETSGTLHDYAVMAIGAWALHLLESQYRGSATAAKDVLTAAHRQLPARHELIALWELFQGGRTHRTAIDTRLGIEHWDLRDKGESRLGVSEVRRGGGEWILRGFLALLLLAEQPSDWELRDFFGAAPPRYLWDPSCLESSLKQLADNSLLGVPEDCRGVAVEQCVALLRSRRTAADADYIVRVATSPLDDEHCDRLRREILEHFEENRHWIRILRQLGATKERSQYATPATLRLGRYIQRDYLIPNNNWAGGLGEYVGREAADWESAMLVALAMTSVQPAGRLESLVSIGERIRDACARLAATGALPNLVVLPSQPRFAGALFQKPLWQVEDGAEVPQIGYGSWEGLTVLKTPFIDADAIIVADAARLFGTVGEKATQVEVLIRDTEDAELREFVDAAMEGGKLPDSGDIRVLVEVLGRPLFGINEPAAGVAIDIRDSDACYAMDPDTDLFHRPSCDDLEGADDVQYSLTRRLAGESEDRRPCAKCKPDRWDVEGGLGRIAPGEMGE